jgi:hypothetical protein
MASTLTRHRVIKIHSTGFIDRAKGSNPGLSQLIDELVIAFFVAMAVMWVVTTVAGVFA